MDEAEEEEEVIEEDQIDSFSVPKFVLFHANRDDGYIFADDEY